MVSETLLNITFILILIIWITYKMANIKRERSKEGEDIRQ